MTPKTKPEAVVRLQNRWAVWETDPDNHEVAKRLFGYRKPGCEWSPGYRDGTWDGWTTVFQAGRVASGLFESKRAECEAKFRLRVIDERSLPEFDAKRELNLREKQEECVRRMIRSTGGIVLNATGTGKTLLAGGYFARLIGSGLFVVDELGLLEQTRRAFADYLGEEIGVVGRSEFLPQRITVATVQTLARHRKSGAFKRWFKKLDAVITDELHVQLGKRNFDVLASIKPKSSFGLTGTLETGKLHVWYAAVALCGPVIFEYSYEEGRDDGVLARSVICRVRFVDPLRGSAPSYVTFKDEERVAVPAGSPLAQYRYHVALNAARNRLIEEVVREGLKRARRIVVLVERKSHLAALSKRFTDIRHEALSGSVKAKARLDAVAEMDAGRLPLILATRVFTKGVDIRTVDMIVDATGLPGRNAALQRHGRGARDASKTLWYFDVSDENNPFSGAAKSRARALKETGSTMIARAWSGDAKCLLDEMERL